MITLLGAHGEDGGRMHGMEENEVGTASEYRCMQQQAALRSRRSIVVPPIFESVAIATTYR